VVEREVAGAPPGDVRDGNRIISLTRF